MMSALKPIINFYINSSIHVALAVFSLSWITLLEYQLPYDENVLYFIFYASITGYNFVKFFGLVKFHHRQLATWLKLIQLFSLLCFILMGYYFFLLDKNAMIFVSICGIITFLYAVPLLPNRIFLDKHNNLRSIAGLKVFIIALVWTGVTVYLPLLNNHFSLNADVIITCIQRFLFIILLMLPFEIRDLRYDSLKLSTIPQIYGMNNTKIVGVLIGVLFFSLEFFKNEIGVNNVIALLIIAILTILMLLFAKKEQGLYYCSFWVEGLPILWLVIILFLLNTTFFQSFFKIFF
tara:strand:+ start:524 stop:1399 length:876 start_codon:yes stop_codon:yes gene_type:complete